MGVSKKHLAQDLFLVFKQLLNSSSGWNLTRQDTCTCLRAVGRIDLLMSVVFSNTIQFIFCLLHRNDPWVSTQILLSLFFPTSYIRACRLAIFSGHHCCTMIYKWGFSWAGSSCHQAGRGEEMTDHMVHRDSWSLLWQTPPMQEGPWTQMSRWENIHTFVIICTQSLSLFFF